MRGRDLRKLRDAAREEGKAFISMSGTEYEVRYKIDYNHSQGKCSICNEEKEDIDQLNIEYFEFTDEYGNTIMSSGIKSALSRVLNEILPNRGLVCSEEQCYRKFSAPFDIETQKVTTTTVG